MLDKRRNLRTSRSQALTYAMAGRRLLAYVLYLTLQINTAVRLLLYPVLYYSLCLTDLLAGCSWWRIRRLGILMRRHPAALARLRLYLLRFWRIYAGTVTPTVHYCMHRGLEFTIMSSN